MTRAARCLAVLIAVLACAFPGAAQQSKHRRTRKHKPAPAIGASSASAATAISPYPYMEAVRQNDLGIGLMDRGKFTDAYAKFQTACIMDIESDVGCQNAGIALLSMQNYDDARKMLAKSAERNPQYARAWFSLGILEYAQGNADAAIADFEKVAAIDPADADTQCLIGLLYMDEKKYDKAIPAFTKAIALDPLLAPAELGLAQAKQQTGDIDDALAHLKRLEEMTAKDTGRTVDFAYGKAGKFSKAEKIIPPEPAPTEPQSSAASPSP
jgi:tetratricopeptide (TPR) repeat protein